ncbi:hypothetical protein NOVOSPHI9U_250019 [Novosphingobium sp. 9U]|nr:hypothetical protein NOVOSPHI9U_250019 [Novosphingobium sp. 9U]
MALTRPRLTQNLNIKICAKKTGTSLLQSVESQQFRDFAKPSAALRHWCNEKSRRFPPGSVLYPY